MKIFANKTKKKIVIADFVCPYKEGRKIFNPDYLIWMDTIKKGRLSTFDSTFQKPKKYDFRIKKKDAVKNSNRIAKKIKLIFSL